MCEKTVNKLTLGLLSTFFLLPTITFGNTESLIDNIESENDYQGEFLLGCKFFTFTLGREALNLDDKQRMIDVNMGTYNFTQKNARVQNTVIGIFIGNEWFESDNWRLVAGIGYYQPQASFISGINTQKQTPSSSEESFNYNYRLSLRQLLLESKIYLFGDANIQPFVVMGLGITRVNFNDYTVDAPPSYYPLKFPKKSSNKLGYVLGIGFDILLNDSVSIEMGYRYVQYGSSESRFGVFPGGREISSGLKQSSLSSHQVLSQFTYIWQ